MKATIKEVVTNPDVWVITKVSQGYNGMIRIDAKRRFLKADVPTFFCNWAKRKYVDNLRSKEGLSKLELTKY